MFRTIEITLIADDGERRSPMTLELTSLIVDSDRDVKSVHVATSGSPILSYIRSIDVITVAKIF